jgi:hypothetical protein
MALTKLQRAHQAKKPATQPVPEPAPVLALAAGKLTADGCELIAPSQLSDSGIRSVSQNGPVHADLGCSRLLSTLLLYASRYNPVHRLAKSAGKGVTYT